MGSYSAGSITSTLELDRTPFQTGLDEAKRQHIRVLKYVPVLEQQPHSLAVTALHVLQQRADVGEHPLTVRSLVGPFFVCRHGFRLFVGDATLGSASLFVLVTTLTRVLTRGLGANR